MLEGSDSENIHSSRASFLCVFGKKWQKNNAGNSEGNRAINGEKGNKGNNSSKNTDTDKTT